MACGFWVQGGEYRFWLLQPDLTNEPDLTPFFFSSGYIYRMDMTAAVETFENKNTDEWYEELKHKTSKKDINALLHETKSQVFFVHQKEFERENSFLALLKKPGNNELYRYFILSKKLEELATNPDPWDEDRPPSPISNALIREADSMYRSSHSSFLKLRIAYQLMRLYAINGQPEKLHRVYDAWIDPVKTNSWIKTAALYRKATHTPGLKSDYLLSKVFDRGGYYRSQCLLQFHTRHTDSILLFAKNHQERTVINAMEVFNYPGRCLARLKSIYSGEPGY
ncbi:MAG TPA: hypothetical protein VFI06_06810, partial [Chitinophagaceae bacterium]|nr:hypothetical protein [Chitinophagaceae bacterium]